MKHWWRVNEQVIPMLDLFSGIGGFALAAEIANAMADAEWNECQRRGRFGELESAEAQVQGEARQQRIRHTDSRSGAFVSIAHAEVEPFACAVYHRHFPDSESFGDVRNVSLDEIVKRTGVREIGVLTAGFPCQPFSCAGKFREVIRFADWQKGEPTATIEEPEDDLPF